MKQKIIQITAGRGPIECSFVVAKILKYLVADIKAHCLAYTIINRVAGNENGTLLSATLMIEGPYVSSFLEGWVGPIQWIGQSPYRKNHKRKNWFIGIYELEKTVFSIMDQKDIQYQTMRSSGAGGQHVNKVSTGVRAIHKPTKISVVSMDTRSQHRNKKLAYERLEQKVYEEQLKKIKIDLQNKWTNHLNIERGNPTKTFKGTDFKKMKKDKSYKRNRAKLKEDLKSEIENRY